MTQPTVPAANVKAYAEILRDNLPDLSYLDGRALALIGGIAGGTSYQTDREVAENVRAALVAEKLVRGELTGMTYSREADDPTPVSPARMPLHAGAVTEQGLCEVRFDPATGCEITGPGGECPRIDLCVTACGEVGR